MLKVMTIVGTRPELIKMSRVIEEFDKHTHHIFVHTGQNFDYELNQIFFKDMGIRKPDHFLDVAGKSCASTIAAVIEKSDAIMAQENPDALLLYGDTNSTLAVISAKRRKIPVFHMEAGNRCFNERVPEELNRKILDHLSDINLVLTEHARRYLLAEGIKGDRIIKTGSHMPEVLAHLMPKIDASTILNTLNIKEQHYFLVSAHREENVDIPEALEDFLTSLEALVATYHFPVIVSTHPRTKKRLEALGLKTSNDKLVFSAPFGFCDYVKLQMNALCILSDSGTITEEASLLNLPAITIRNEHERPEGMDEGTLIMSGLKTENVLDAVRITIAQHQESPSFRRVIEDYKNAGVVSKKILRIVMSYTHFVNKVVWSK